MVDGCKGLDADEAPRRPDPQQATLFLNASGDCGCQRAKKENDMDPRSFAAPVAVPAHDKRFALLIDADNVSAKYLKPILDELSKYGTVTIKRIYGDWTLSLHAKWKAALLENSITPIQQFGYTQGKNATDSAMIIDAMDILYANSVEGFCIVSSDSDFTRLAARIRESGLTVVGMGEKKTPVPFRMACDVFTTLELLLGSGRRKGSGKGAGADASEGGEVPEATASKAEIEQAVVDIITDNTNNGKATGLGEIGSRLQKRYPDFDVRSYGTNLLSKLLSDFASVKVAKDGSNVAVELADGFNGVVAKEDGSQEREASEEPARADAAEEAEASEADEGDARKGRRRRRGRRGGRGLRSADAAEEAAAGGDEGSEGSAAERAEDEPVSPDSEEPTGEGGAPEPESKDEPAPKRSRRRRKAQGGSAEAEEEPGREAEVEAEFASGQEPQEEPEAKPARKSRRSRAKNAELAAEASPAVEAGSPAPDGAAEDENEAPRRFLVEAIAQAGEDGASIESLSRSVRARFKKFRVTKTGYRNLRLYVASFPGVEIEKREDDSYAVMR